MLVIIFLTIGIAGCLGIVAFNLYDRKEEYKTRSFKMGDGGEIVLKEEHNIRPFKMDDVFEIVFFSVVMSGLYLVFCVVLFIIVASFITVVFPANGNAIEIDNKTYTVENIKCYEGFFEDTYTIEYDEDGDGNAEKHDFSSSHCDFVSGTANTVEIYKSVQPLTYWAQTRCRISYPVGFHIGL